MELTDGGRILFDISTSMRSAGPPTGIVRVERKLALWAYANVQNVEFVFFDPRRLVYSALTCDARQFLTGEAVIDDLEMTNPALPGRRRTDRIPAPLRRAFLWITQTRRMGLNRLERLRLRTQSPQLAHLGDRLQRCLMSAKYRRIMVRDDNMRRPFYPCNMVVGAPITFRRSDTLVCTGCGWVHTNIEAIDDAKSRIGFRTVLMCHDLIPVLFPHFYRAADVELFANYMLRALAMADRIVVSSRAVEADCKAYCAQHGVIVQDVIVGPLGYDVGAKYSGTSGKLPSGLRAGHFALLVSTIEPRKGHALLCKIWRRLLAEGVPQTFDFKLLFVGRAGWMVDHLLTELRSDPLIAGQILVLHDVDDGLLAALYQSAAFCLYPSIYEGYGLPIVEAFSHGKAVLTSSGGALPELAKGFSPCLDPFDEQAWYGTVKQWIEMPDARALYEREIHARFRHPTWTDAAASFFASISDSAGVTAAAD
jgi:glycosyltransferase involved in cell wall biosynthesis